jgi:hypothetical protein
MKFHTLGEIPFQSDDRVFKSSPVREGVSFIVFLALAISLLLLAIGKGKLHWLDPFICYITAATLGLFAWLAFGRFRASLKPTSWLLRCNDDGIIIKYRSFLNWRFPAEDVQAVGFDYSEIAWVRTVKEKRISPSTDGKGGSTKQTQRFVFLDFCLANTDTSAIEARLQAEQNVNPAGLTITHDYPVEVLSGGIIQLRWNGISPSIREAIEYLSRHVKIAAVESTKFDLTRNCNRSPDEEKAKIVQLAKSGDKMGAVTLARQIYGYNLSVAVAFVEKLQSDDAKSK